MNRNKKKPVDKITFSYFTINSLKEEKEHITN